MKLLWVLPYAPTPIRTRSHALLQVLVERGHSLTLATVWDTEDERTVLEKLEAQGMRVVAERRSKIQSLMNMIGAYSRGEPLQCRYSWSPRLAGWVQTLLQEEEFDAVHVEHLRGAEYGLLAKRMLVKRGQAKRVVWDSVDCISLLFDQAARNSRSRFGRWVTRLELPRTRRYERHLVRAFRSTLVTSVNDKAGLERLAGAILPQVEVLPNGVNTHYFYPDDTVKNSAEVVFSGKLSYHANETAALHLVKSVMPYVWAKRPEARVVLVGKDPGRELIRLGKADERVIVTGTVADIRPYLRRAMVATAFIPYGVGIQNKVLEAMACGTAVVGSPQAVSALAVTPGIEIMVVEGAEAQARLLLQVLKDDELRSRLSTAGRAYVERQHDWQQITSQLERTYRAGYEYD
jgi:glycosyltransferase involved in cell wall biosynthesis